MKREEALELAANGFEELSQALAEGKSEALTAYLNVMSRFHSYSFRNCLLIAMQCPTASRVAGYRQWPKLGRHVKKGEKGIGILAPLVYKQKADDAPVANGSGDDASRTVRGFKIVHVFDIEQTEGDPLPELNHEIGGDPGDWIAKLEGIVREASIQLEYVDDLDGAKGVSAGGTISLLSDLMPAETFAVLAHEYAHEILHKGERRQETTKRIRETEAEAVAFVVSNAIGLNGRSQASDYIQLYNGDPETLRESMHFIQHTSAQIIEQLLASDPKALTAPVAETKEVQHVP